MRDIPTRTDSWFIRHWPSDREWSWTRDQNIQIQQRLFDAHEIAIYYQPKRSLDPNAYPPEQRKWIKLFLSLLHNGGYICAHYPAIRRTLIGKLKPVQLNRVLCNKDFLKRVRITKAQEVEGWKKMLLTVASPRQGTLGRWHKIGELLQLMVEGKNLPSTWGLLPPHIQETVCQEYMRRRHGMAYLMLPFGRTLADVDVAGITKMGSPIFSQITLSTDAKAVREKAERLLSYEGNRICFCPKFAEAESIQRTYGASVDFVWTDEVWNWLMKKDVYKRQIFAFLSNANVL